MSFLSRLISTTRALSPTRLSCLKPNVRAFSNKPKPNITFSILTKYALLTAATSFGLAVGFHTFGYLRHSSNLFGIDAADSQQTLRRRFNFIDKVVQKCSGGVVYIEIKDPTKIDLETDQPLTSSNGSGFIISEDGWILTNAHVVVNKPQSIVMVMLEDGSMYQAKIEDADMNIDLALLKIDTNRKLPFLSLAKSSDIATGEWVVALGSPLSLSHSVTAGVISSVSRGAEDLGLKNFSMRYIQTDAAITFGNSGGPLVNLDGDVVGINNLRVTAGIAFAIPVDYAKTFLSRSHFSSKADVVNTKKDTKRFLGITTISITKQILEEIGSIPNDIGDTLTHGVMVWKIIKGTLAQLSGLEAGDIITHINGVPVYQASDIYDIEPESSSLKLDIIRKGIRRDITVN